MMMSPTGGVKFNASWSHKTGESAEQNGPLARDRAWWDAVLIISTPVAAVTGLVCRALVSGGCRRRVRLGGSVARRRDAVRAWSRAGRAVHSATNPLRERLRPMRSDRRGGGLVARLGHRLTAQS